MIESLKGTKDILPPDSELWRYVENIARGIFAKYGYLEIRTPIIENSVLFIRGVGKDTDIVQKQMYTFMDQGDRNICLRPEATASVVRAYIENHLYKTDGFLKLFYCGTMYRSEKPQAGRQREFSQIGVEVLGSYSPYCDCEIIILLDNILKALGINDYKLKINSLGCEKDKDALKKQLKDSLKGQIKKLCPDCQKRYDTNILRILDCKNEACIKLLHSIRITDDILCDNCRKDFNFIVDVIKRENVNYEIDKFLVRGLDYYTKTVFEAVSSGLGARDAIAAGGRYDNLVCDLGGPKTGACGFAIGFERLLGLIKKEDIKYKAGSLDLFMVCMNEAAMHFAFSLQHELRKKGISCDIDYQARSLKAQMRYADKIKAKFSIVIGENELLRHEVNLKNMNTGEQKTVRIEKLAESLC